jgi:hypothetical protein
MGARRAAGGCLCGAVRYEVRGPLRDVVLCHCAECRRWTGHVLAATAARTDDLIVVRADGLRWFDSPDSDRSARRGFCERCGSSLFWEPRGARTTSIAAGSLDQPTGLRLAGHWYSHQVGDYYEIVDDLPRDDRSTTALPDS